jgi:protein-arginine kinase activator protein McsA
MLCENCHEREATVHVTDLTDGLVLARHDFCEICSPIRSMSREELNAERTKLLGGNDPDKDHGPEQSANPS